MIEMPEAITLAAQINETVGNKRIRKITAGYTPHKRAWYYRDRAEYSRLVAGKTVDTASGFGALVHVKAGDSALLFGG